MGSAPPLLQQQEVPQAAAAAQPGGSSSPPKLLRRQCSVHLKGRHLWVPTALRTRNYGIGPPRAVLPIGWG
jgi:hypothetical protein